MSSRAPGFSKSTLASEKKVSHLVYHPPLVRHCRKKKKNTKTTISAPSKTTPSLEGPAWTPAIVCVSKSTVSGHEIGHKSPARFFSLPGPNLSLVPSPPRPVTWGDSFHLALDGCPKPWKLGILSRSSSRELRISWYPMLFLSAAYFLVGEPSRKKVGQMALLGDQFKGFAPKPRNGHPLLGISRSPKVHASNKVTFTMEHCLATCTYPLKLQALEKLIFYRHIAHVTPKKLKSCVFKR